MKTFHLPLDLTRSQATQHVFLNTGYTMFPILTLYGWEYHVPEPCDAISDKEKQLLKPLEIKFLLDVCNNLESTSLCWFALFVAIKSLPHQQRFNRETYNQAHMIAGSLAAFVMVNQSLN